MQDDDAGALIQCVDDPAVGIRIVADVVERNIRCRGAACPCPRRRPRLVRAEPAGAAWSSRRSRSATAAAASSRRPSREQSVDAGVPGDTLGERVTGSAPRLRFVEVAGEVRAGMRDVGRAPARRRAPSRGRARPRAGRRRRPSSRPACPRGTPRTGPCRSPRRAGRSRRPGSAHTDPRGAHHRRARRTPPGRSARLPAVRAAHGPVLLR